MKRSERRPRRGRVTTIGYLGLIVGLAAAAFATAQSAAPPATPPPAPTAPAPTAPATTPASPAPPKPFSPTERINVEQAVDFPFDI